MAIPWAQIDLSTDAAGLVRAQVTASSGGRTTPGRACDGLTSEDLQRAGRGILRLVRQDRPMGPTQLQEARAIYTRIFTGDVGQVVDQLRGEGQGRVLVRLMVPDPNLRSLPWEVMVGPAELDGPLACHPNVRVVRGVFSTEPAVPREVRGALRILAVATAEMAYAVEDMHAGLGDAIATGRVEWLEPAVGAGARWTNLLPRLQRTPRPHVMHFVCHGRVADGGEPELLLDPEENRWTPVRTLSTALASTVGADLRLVYLEACAGADAGALASAAEHLAARGVEGVVAHLWPVGAVAARLVSGSFYDTLVGAAAGDVATALNTARLSLSGTGTAEFLSPVLVLRGHDPALFDMSRQRLQAPVAKAGGAVAGAADPRILAILRDLEQRMARPSTLLVGELVDPDGGAIGVRQIEKEIRSLLDNTHDAERLPALLQRFQLEEAREELKAVFQEVLDEVAREAAPGTTGIVGGLARLARPGLFVTLLWLPLLEDALALVHPDKEILVYQPLKPGAADRMRVFRRDPATGQWDRLRAEPERLDFAKQIVVLRLHGGYTAAQRTLLGEPVLTDDDHLVNLAVLDTLPNQLLAFLRNNPMQIVGVSPLAWAHRELLRRLLGEQPLAAGSIAVTGRDATSAEKRYWQNEGGPGGRGGSVDTLSFEDLVAAIGALAPA